MKTFSGTFSNGQPYVGVEMPENAKSFFMGGICKVCNLQGIYHCNEAESCGNTKAALKLYKDNNRQDLFDSIELPDGDYSILGKYQTKGEIDFEVNQEWVGYEKGSSNFKSQIILKFLSLLDRDSRMAFPLEENEFTEPDPSNYFDTTIPINELTKLDAVSVSMYNSALDFYEMSESQVRPKRFLIILIK